MMIALDRACGMIFEKLEELDLDENTLKKCAKYTNCCSSGK